MALDSKSLSVSVSETPVRAPIPWVVYVGVVGLMALAGVLIWTTDQVLTNRFSESSRGEAELKLALLTGNLQSEMRQKRIVPLLLASDPLFAMALRSDDFARTSQRLIRFRNQIGAKKIVLLDRDGRVVGSSERVELGRNMRSAPFVISAMRSNQTVYTSQLNDLGLSEFYFSRRVLLNGDTVGFIAVQVDLERFFGRWAELSTAVALLESNGTILLATEPVWRGLKEDDLLSGALRDRTVPASRMELPSFDAARVVELGGPVITEKSDPFFQGWRLVSYATTEEVRTRVNAVLAVEVTGFAILLALLFLANSRRSDRRSVSLARESDRLRQLNRRLQSEIAERERAERNLQVAEQSLAQSSKLAALGEMSAAVSHELNQPLAAMKTYLAGAKLLMQRGQTDEATASFHRINGLIDRMGSITRQLKAHARKPSANLTPTDLVECLNNVIDMMTPQLSQASARLVHSVPDNPVIVMADPVRIEQVLVNLLRNGLDATADVTDPCVEVTLTCDGDTRTHLIVQDNGQGIKDLDALFEPFYTTKEPGEGLGLGLAISSSIISSYGGRLTARNGAEGGAIFKLELPLEGDPTGGSDTTPTNSSDID